MHDSGDRSEPVSPDLYLAMRERYERGDLPWEQQLPPPEIQALTQHLAPGRALDLGCGAGRASIWLAKHGWHCDGVDFIPAAIQRATQRAEAEQVADRVRFLVARVTHLAMLTPGYDLAIDVGCLHAQSDTDRAGYARELTRLVRPGGRYVLFAHHAGHADGTGPRGIAEAAVRTLFQDAFRCERMVPGTTTVRGLTVPSAWWYFQRHPES